MAQNHRKVVEYLCYGTRLTDVKYEITTFEARRKLD